MNTILRTSALVHLALAAGVFSASLQAAPIEVAGITYADKLEVGGESLTLNGAGLRKIVFFKVYAAGLYVPEAAKTLDAVTAQPGARRVRLTLLRDVSGSDFIEALDDGLQQNLRPESSAAIANELQALKAIMTGIGDVKTGDVVDFDFTVEKGTTVTHNGNAVGEAIPGKPLYDAVLAIWLGEKPIDNTLKSSLLGSK